MSILKRIDADLAKALKSAEKIEVSTLRALKSAIHNEQISKGAELSDGDIQRIIKKEAKQRAESITSFKQGDRQELARQEQAELNVIKKYLPESLDKKTVEIAVDKAISELNAQGVEDMSKVMSILSKQISAGADMAEVAQLVKQKLAKN